MNAILYVAGRAARLGKEAKGRPKVLLEFGGLTLLERHVRLLARIGVPRLFIVTGHLRNQIEAACPDLETRYGIELVEMFNPDFTEGSALSMCTSLPVLKAAAEAGEEILLMDGDVLYDIRMLDRLVQSAHPSALLVDLGYSTVDDDPVLVPMRKGKPFDFIKKWQGEADSVGESIGFFKMSPTDLPLLIRETGRRAVGPGRAESYDDILRLLVQDGRFGAEDVTGIPWTEIDFPEDIAFANGTILPALRD